MMLRIPALMFSRVAMDLSGVVILVVVRRGILHRMVR